MTDQAAQRETLWDGEDQAPSREVHRQIQEAEAAAASECLAGEFQQGDLLSLHELFDTAAVPYSVGELREFRRKLTQMPRIGAYNAMLLHVQRPGARFAATAHEWAKYGRAVKPGANRLIILRPYGPVEFVYEVSDTEGAELPPELLEPFAAHGSVTAEGLEWLMHRLPEVGVSCQRVVNGSLQAAQIEWYGAASVRKGGRRVQVPHYTVSINASLDPNTAFAALAHELGHLFCGHLDVPTETRFRVRRGLPLESKELEAESVAWVLTRRVGVHTQSVDYLRGYVSSGLPPVDMERVAFAVNKIEALAGGAMALGERLRHGGAAARGRRTGRAGAASSSYAEPTLFEDVPLFEL